MKIKAYTIFTDSHKRMFCDYLMTSFPFRQEIELTVLYRGQACKTAEFETNGWKDTMKEKAKCFVDGITSCKEDEVFMFIDPDIQFFGDFYDDIKQALDTCDVVWQNDVIGGVNTGFFVARSTKATRGFFKTVLGNLDSDQFKQEQELANYLLRQIHLYPTINFKWKFLPNTYWTYGHIAAQPKKDNSGLKGSWKPEDDDFDIPTDIKMHHANWTLGVDNKETMLKIVRSKYKNIYDQS
jgi:hypothetical protein